MHLHVSQFIALHAGDAVGSHYSATVDLPKRVRVQLGQQLFKRGAQQVFTRRTHGAYVLVGGLQKKHLG